VAPARGFRRARVSQARAWGIAARRLLGTGEYPDIELGYVAAYLAIAFTHQLVSGDSKFHRRGDKEARSDCPVDPSHIEEWRARLMPVRNGVLHLGEDPKPDRTITVIAALGAVTVIVTHWRPRTAGDPRLQQSTPSPARMS